jgi:hypothetical protein
MKARDICSNIRRRLRSMNTSHFPSQAQDGWYAIDRLASGLNALLNLSSSSALTSALEARDKLGAGLTYYLRSVREINQRRALYGLPPLYP